MPFTQQLVERLAAVSKVNPQLADNTTVNGDYVDLSKFRRVVFALLVGATDTTVDFTVREAQDTGGTGEALISGKTATQLDGTDDGKIVLIEVAAEELSAGYRYVRPRAVVGDGATGAYVCIIGFAGDARHEPASDNDLAAVDEIVI